MSHPIQENNHATYGDSQLNKSSRGGNNDGDLVHSFFGLANRMMDEMLRGRGGGGMSSFMSTDSNNPNVKVFGVSSMNVTQISRGADGRPHIVQAHDERRMGPGGVWQTKKAFRDPDHGIDRMQVGYFVGDQGEIVERHLDPNNGQYRQEIKRRGLPSNEVNFSNQWRKQATQQSHPLTSERRQQQQQLPPYEQYSQQALPPSSTSYQYY